MIHTTQRRRDEDHCSDGRLRSFLMMDESTETYQSIARHVEHCSRCQNKLEELAAAPSDWTLAFDVLSTDGDDLFLPQATEPNPWIAMQETEVPAAWTESMLKQLLDPPSHPEMLGKIGRYEVERLIGSGGMGVVFKAFDHELNRPVAIKVLSPMLAGNGSARQRFSREARAAAAIVHEHVVAIHNVESGTQSPFLVMQYVAGESLQQRLDRVGPLELREILRIGLQTASGLAAAHAQGLVHRDVKPSNILLEYGIDRSLLTDFGLAQAADDATLTQTGYHPGTPQYMSPEQASGDSIDARSDLFSLGSVLYAMCTGRPPFRAESSLAILRRIIDTEPRSIREVNPSIPSWLEQLIKKLLVKDPNQRLGSAKEAAMLLARCLAHVQHPTSEGLPAELLPTRSNQKMKRLSLLAIPLVFMFVFGFFWKMADRTSQRPHESSPSSHAQIEPGPPSSDATKSTEPAMFLRSSDTSRSSESDPSLTRWESTQEAIQSIRSRLESIAPRSSSPSKIE